MKNKAEIKKKYFKSNISISKIVSHLKNKFKKEDVSKEKFLDWYGYDYIDKKVLKKNHNQTSTQYNSDLDLIIEILNDDFYGGINAKIWKNRWK